MARKWLSNCVSSHGICRTSQPTILPTRVLEVKKDGDKVYLRETNGMEGQYATLSHCWGGSFPLTTMVATLESRKHGISFEELPKTFQEAIIVTRRLEIQYLWIDSLCIIQDSDEDWLRESSLMAKVYEGAFVNISADDAANSKAGLGSSRKSLARNTIIHNEGVYVSRALLRQNFEVAHALLDDNYTGRLFETTPCVLSTRAWVLQERMLSTRILHFAFSELAWECDTHIECECCLEPRTADQRCIRTFTNPFTTSNLDTATYRGKTVKKSEVWGTVLQAYNESSLTYDTDALNAILGLASMMAISSSKTFMAGLWKEDLPWGLLWRNYNSGKGIHSPQFVAERRKKYFPSWSWASIRGRLCMNLVAENFAAQELRSSWLLINGVNCENQDSFNFVDYRSGCMHVSGWMATVSLPDTTGKNGSDIYWSFRGSWRLFISKFGSKIRVDVTNYSEFTPLVYYFFWWL